MKIVNNSGYNRFQNLIAGASLLLVIIFAAIRPYVAAGAAGSLQYLNMPVPAYNATTCLAAASAKTFHTPIRPLEPVPEALNGFSEINLSEINSQRERFERRAMTTLLVWGAANTAAGTALLFTDWNDAGLMTLSWGAINAGIAFLAISGQERLNPESPGLVEFLRREQGFQRIVAVNAGLNVSYITAGLLMGQYGNRSRTRQFGTAVAVQGAFLLAFDSYLLYRSTRYLDRLMPLLNTVSVYPDSVLLLPGVGFSF